jgi:hypothetical protein
MEIHKMRVSSPLLLSACVLAVSTGVPAAARGQAPSITSTYPQAAQPGQTIDLKLRGAGLAAPTQFWASFAGEFVLPTEIQGNGTNAAEVTYRVKLPADAPLGVHGIRVATAQGISSLKLFAIDDLPSVAQAKPNQTAEKAQMLTIPVAVDGAVDSLARDYYKFQVAAGQRLSFEVLARRLGSALDPMIRLLDARGRELAYSDDAPGLGPDSQLSFTFKDAGEYFLEVRDIRYQGGANFQYRLRIGDFPCVTVPYPMGIQKGVSAQLAFAGTHAQEAQPVALNLPAESDLRWLHVGAKAPGGNSSGFAIASVSAAPEAVEVEPNNEQPQATRVTLGDNLNGRFDQLFDVDRFIFTAKAGQHFTFSGVTRSQGSPADLFLRLLKSDGGEVATADDAGTNEGLIDYKFPADGDYTLVVEDLNRRGGPELAYRIAVTPHVDAFQLDASADTLNVPAGGAAVITVTVVRAGVNGPISLSLQDAPEGLIATPAVIGPGLNSTVVTVQAAPSVAAGKVYPVRIVGVAQTGAGEVRDTASVAAAQRAAFNGMLVPPPELETVVALGVSPAPEFVLKTEPAELVFGQDLSAKVKVVATRTADFAEEIALAVATPAGAPPQPQSGLPAGVTAAVKPIAKGTNEIEVVFSATNKTPLGEFNVVLLGTGKKGNATTQQPIPSLRLRIQAPFALKPDFAGGKLAKGQTLKVKVVAERNPAYNGPITLAFQKLPKGVTAAAATIAEGQNEVEVVLTAAADAAVGAVKDIVVQGEGKNGDAKLTATSSAVELNVE